MFREYFTTTVPGSLVHVAGMMNSEKYNDVIKHILVPPTYKNLPKGDGILQHDFAPYHTSRKIKKEIEELTINMRQWAGINPDLNSTVKFRSIGKGRLGKM